MFLSTNNRRLTHAACALCVVSASAWAQSPTTQTEQSKLLKAPEAVGMLGADLFGDKLNYYNGSLEFVQIDVSLKGNNALPMSVGRRLVTGGQNEVNKFDKSW